MLSTRADWLRRLTTPHPLISSRFFTGFFIRLELMHTNDTQGVINIVTAEILVMLLRTEPALGPNQETRMAEINVLLQAYYSEFSVPHRIHHISIANLFQGGKSSPGVLPELHGPQVKAANTRWLLPCCRTLAEQHLLPVSTYNRSVLKVVCCLDDIVRLLYDSPMHMSREAIATSGFRPTCEIEVQ